MRPILLLVEGPDDLAAFRELLLRRYGFTKRGRSERFPGARSEQYSQGTELELHLVAAEGRQGVAAVASKQIEEPSLDAPFLRIGINFDPNGQSDDEWMAWVRRCCLPSNATVSQAGVALCVQTGSPCTEVVPIPWDLGPVFNALDDRRNLERAVLGILDAAGSPEGELVRSLLAAIRDADFPTTWKSAVKLWNAIRKPDADTVGFVAQVFGQDHALEQSLSSLLDGSDFLNRLEYFIRPIAAS